MSCRAESIHAVCEDYRASAGIDLVHDRESRGRGDKVDCATRPRAAGHFIPEELHQETAQALRAFFA